MARALPLDIDWITCAEPGCLGVVHDPSGRCLAHLDASEFERALRALRPGGALDMRGAVIDSALAERLLAAFDDGGRARLGRTRFDHARFTGDARFAGTVFDRDVSFDHARFEGLASFFGARFAGNASFGHARFARELSFHGATVAGHAAFDQVIVDRDALFGEARFQRTASFRGARFHGFTAFDAARFARGVSFRGTRFNRAVSFRKAVFCGAAGFESTRFGAATYLTPASAGKGLVLTGAHAAAGLELCAHDCAVDLRSALVAGPLNLRLTDAEADLEGLVLRGGGTLVGRGRTRLLSLRRVEARRLMVSGVDLSGCRFAGLRHPEGLSLSGCEFASTPRGVRLGLRWPYLHWWSPRRVLAEERDWRGWAPREHATAGEKHPERLTPEALSTLYLALRETLDDRATADDFAFGAMEVRRTTSRSTGRWLLSAYWLICGYGLRMGRAACWFVLVTLVAAGSVLSTSASHAARRPAPPPVYPAPAVPPG
ncbi:hypothetical protein Misp01_17790 [Microtetraspora sp. NBRC 13810]|uniref:pentapeptide repeat-containing protein n=1 Tax=Microtetraspora sp. NBRC 13810 TaxID=3030990 RepID=UPI0024A0631B|nr:pentapeptide repeat-containing protein [Microtetraspora sp. NBRC 13810]GLW06649.1 hypothetical protein Misp01_17790 [Microtetraspora sp. NBRC 13810]